MILDFHTHLFSPGVRDNRDVYCSDPAFALLNSAPTAPLASHEDALRACSRDGVDRMVAMAFAWHEERYCEEQNAYLATLNEISAGAISAFGSIPLIDRKNAATWARTIKSLGLAGIGEIAFYARGLTVAALDYLYAVLDQARAFDLPLCIHVNEPVGHGYPGKYEPSLAELYRALGQYRDLTIVLSHWGGGLFFYELMPEVREALGHCYYDTAATPYLYSEEIYSVGMRILGDEKIIFGSDYPLLGAKRYIEAITRSVKNEESRKRILGGNAARILNRG
jgi:predicted TIM-barrel fold metal-dependent hydrolase